MEPPRHNGKTRQELEQELLDAVESTRSAYDLLANEYRVALELVKDVGFNADGDDRFQAMREIHSKVRDALAKHREALGRFNDLLVRRNPPQ